MPKALSNNLVGTLATKVKSMLGDYYTKTEANDKFALKSVINVLTSTYATKNEMNSNLQAKQDTLVGTGDNQNVKTINGTSIVGVGNIVTPTTEIVQGTGNSETAVMSQSAVTSALNNTQNMVKITRPYLINQSIQMTGEYVVIPDITIDMETRSLLIIDITFRNVASAEDNIGGSAMVALGSPESSGLFASTFANINTNGKQSGVQAIMYLSSAREGMALKVNAPSIYKIANLYATKIKF